MCGATRNRTGDTRIFSPLLYQLSYGTALCLTGAKVGKILYVPNLSKENIGKISGLCTFTFLRTFVWRKNVIKMNKFHPFSSSVAYISLPEKFTFPFHYTPHPLCVKAAEELQQYLQQQDDWQDDLLKGKMFGVLVVKTSLGELGYLAAFSGILAGKNLQPFFVPPIYDLQQPDGFFAVEEAAISEINVCIRQLVIDDRYISTQKELNTLSSFAQKEIETAKADYKKAQQIREEKRQKHPSSVELSAMIRESQHQKAELRRLKQYWEKQIVDKRAELQMFVDEIDVLKKERKNRSAALQQQLFAQFKLLNGKGEIRDLCDIFRETVQKVPPAGAGECAAPKLLQYAYQHHLCPVAMAEFWWGNSPKQEIRHHGYYYPACKSKCEPILNYMLQGLDVEENPLEKETGCFKSLEIVYEDEWLLVVNKPAGMLSAPGKITGQSVYQWMKERYPDATGPLIVHRLDMATSGLLLMAKTKDVYLSLQSQFATRQVKKRYIALLDGLLAVKDGIITLPLCLNPEERPRQMVSSEYGKPALTEYRVISSDEKRTRIAFYPLTGRTHQLRVHASHLQGLNTPIVGDELYGKNADRLYLHAEYLEFKHPVTGELIRIEREADF